MTCDIKSIIDTIENPKNNKKYIHCGAVVKFINNSNDSLKFCSMTCSWTSQIMNSKSDIYIFVDACDKNFPNLFKLAKSQSVNFYTDLYIPIDINWKKEQFIEFDYELLNDNQKKYKDVFDSFKYAKKEIINIKIPISKNIIKEKWLQYHNVK